MAVGFFGKLLHGGSKVSKTINKLDPKVNKTKSDEIKSTLAKTIQKTKASGAKLDQTKFEIENKLPLTFGKSSKKTMSNTERAQKAELRKKEKKQENKTKHFYAPENFNKGGRVGLKRGTGLMKTKSNVKKIKETFGPKKGLGMQSVIYGLDKNPKITAADPKAKFIAAAKKKTKKRFV